MKMRDVIESEKCYTKDMYNDFEEKKGKNYYNGVIIKELFKQYGINYDNKKIMDIVKDKMPLDVFHTSREEIINTTLLVLRLLRFQEYFTKERLPSNAIVHNGGFTFVTKHNIQVDYNLIIEDGNQIEIVKVKNKKSDLTVKGKSVHTKISDNMELFLLSEAAKKLFPNKLSYNATIVFLRHSNDRGNNLIPVSDFSKGKTIASTSFTGSKVDEMLERIDDILNGKSKHECSDCSTCVYNVLCKYKKDKTNLLVIPQKPKASGNVTFTDAQKSVIDAENGVYRVLAGAGSGKTTCIANRICELLKKGVLPQDILLITYTIKGADEMREKIAYWTKQNKVKANLKNLSIFTFNGFGFELVKKEYAKFGYTKEPSLLEKSEKTALIKKIIDSKPEIPGFDYENPTLNMPYAKGVVLMMNDYFTKIKIANLTYPEDVANICGIKDLNVARQVLEFYQEYKQEMKDNNLVDYLDQVNLCYEILQDPICLKKYGYQYIIVDEFQDSNGVQIAILKLLESYAFFKSLMVVGDDSQSIFAFTGASAYNIIHFKDIFPNAFDIPLLENFRATQELCTLANGLNDINKEKVPKSLISKKHGDKPILFNVSTIESFVDKVMDAIVYYGYSFSDVCLIARNRKHLLEIQKFLISKNVPCVLSVNELLIENPVVKHLIDFAKYLQDLSSDLYFAEYLQIIDYENYEKQTKTTLGTYVKTKKDDFEQNLINFSTEKEKIDFVISKFEEIAKEERSVKSLVDILKSKNFITLYDMCQFMIDMETYQADYAIEKLESPVNAITLTTAHSSKGREWNVVGVYLDSFDYPSNLDYNQVKNNAKFEEERRLLFVSVTRAKEFLFLGGNCDTSCYKEVANIVRKIK